MDETSKTKCLRCGHTWNKRVGKPLRCPKCSSVVWFKPKKPKAKE